MRYLKALADMMHRICAGEAHADSILEHAASTMQRRDSSKLWYKYWFGNRMAKGDGGSNTRVVSAILNLQKMRLGWKRLPLTM